MHNPDGTVTLVVATRDPGVANWLDTTGTHEGTLFALTLVDNRYKR
jgi:hypothetical protein